MHAHEVNGCESIVISGIHVRAALYEGLHGEEAAVAHRLHEWSEASHIRQVDICAVA